MTASQRCRTTRARLITHNLIVFITYAAAAAAGLRFASVHPSATAIWPPTGIAIASFLLLGPGVAPAIFAAAFAINALTAGSLATSIGIAFGNALEGAVAAALVSGFAGGVRAFDRAADTFRYAVLAGFISTVVSPTIGVTTLAAFGYASWAQYGSIWFTWWLGDVAGALVVGPLIVLWATESPHPVAAGHRAEAAAAFAMLVSIAAVVFGGVVPAIPNYPLAFLCLPAVVWIAFRFGPRGAASAIFVLSVIAASGTMRGAGPFGAFSGNGPLVLQGYMTTLAVTTLVMSALVAERRRVENDRARLLGVEQQARRDAEEAARAKDQFLAMLGHELRNPLAAISSAVHVTKRSAQLQGRAAAAQEIISRQVTHLNRLVDDLLDASRVATGKIVLERQPVELEKLITRTIAVMEQAGLTSPHRIDTSTERVWIDGDLTRLEQIVMNLLANAVKYTPPGGRVRIAVTRDAGTATITVSDTGIGMDAALLPHIFDMFEQGPRGLDRAQGGLGIGLTLVKHLVELHGGVVCAASDGRDAGSTFTVTLPALAASDSPPSSTAVRAAEAGAAGRTETRRILIVEDQQDVRQMLRFALESAGHEVVEASTGPGGVEAVANYRPDVAVVDIGLPVFDGFEVARRVRRMPDGTRPLLVALTGYGDVDARERAEEAGFDLYLVKPVDPDYLSELVLGQAM